MLDVSENEKSHHSFIVTTKNDVVDRTLDETSCLCDPLCFALFHAHAEFSYQSGLKNATGKNVSLTIFYRYKLFQREKNGRKL